MNKEETIDILSGLLRYESVKDNSNYYVDVPIEDLMDDDGICSYRYTVMEDGDIQVEKRKNSNICGSPVKKKSETNYMEDMQIESSMQSLQKKLRKMEGGKQ